MRGKNEIRQNVKSQTDSITRLISPGDLVHQDIDNWENADMERLKRELREGMSEWSYQAHHPYETDIRDLALLLYRKDMVRVPFDHLVFESRHKAVREGYWLYDMSVYEVNEKIGLNWDDIEHMHEYVSEAQMTIESWVLDEQVAELE